MDGFSVARLVWSCLSICGLLWVRKGKAHETAELEMESDADPMIHLRQTTNQQHKRRVRPAF